MSPFVKWVVILFSVVIDINQSANLTLFDPSVEYIFTSKDIRSRSSNSPYIGKSLKGKVIGTILNEHTHINDNRK